MLGGGGLKVGRGERGGGGGGGLVGMLVAVRVRIDCRCLGATSRVLTHLLW